MPVEEAVDSPFNALPVRPGSNEKYNNHSRDADKQGNGWYGREISQSGKQQAGIQAAKHYKKDKPP